MVTIANMDAAKAIEQFHGWSNRRLLIIGEEGAGKTHLSEIWCEDADAKIIEEDFDFETECNLVLENIELLPEEFVFHVINYAHNNGVYLLMTAEFMPSFKLPDLVSRINASSIMLIKPPDESLMKILLAKRLSDWQFRFDHEVLDYLIPRVERSYQNIAKLTNQINNAVSSHKAPLTVRMLKGILEGGVS